MSRALYSDSDMPQGIPSLSPYSILPPHDQAIGLFKQTARRRAHDERRHKIFEHRARPRDKARTAVNRRQGAAEPEPVLRRNVALGDGDEARQSRFGREQIVEIGIETAVGAAITDRKKLAIGIEQKAEFHRVEHRPGRFRKRRQAAEKQPRRLLGVFQCADQRVKIGAVGGSVLLFDP